MARGKLLNIGDSKELPTHFGTVKLSRIEDRVFEARIEDHSFKGTEARFAVKGLLQQYARDLISSSLGIYNWKVF